MTDFETELLILLTIMVYGLGLFAAIDSWFSRLREQKRQKRRASKP